MSNLKPFTAANITAAQVQAINESPDYIVSGGGGFPIGNEFRDESLAVTFTGVFAGAEERKAYSDETKKQIKIGFANLKFVSGSIHGKPFTAEQTAKFVEFLQKQNQKAVAQKYSVLVNMNKLVRELTLNTTYTLEGGCLINEKGRIVPFATFAGDATATAEQPLPATATAAAPATAGVW